MRKIRQSGFSLIEVLVSIVLLSILFVAVLYPMTNSFRLTRQSKNNLQSTSDAQKTMEKARQLVITNYGSGARISNLLSAPEFNGITCENINLYNQVMSPSNCSSIDNPPLRRLTLTKRTPESKTDDIILQVGIRP